MEQVLIKDKELVIMNLVHYFVTEKDYNPVIVHGINDEIWLENMKSEYKLVRIVSRYIHNDEQLNYNKLRSFQIAKKLKLKTFSFKMNMLSIYTDIGDNVSDISKMDKDNLSVFIEKITDIKDNPTILNVFPDIIEKTNHDEKGLELLFKITDDINGNNERKNKKMEKIFSSKKPIVTVAIIVICVVMFLISGMGYDTGKLIMFGANSTRLVKNGELYRLFTYMFLHGGFLHIFMNMYSLYIVGTRVEDFFGKWKYLLIYLVSGICGGLLSIGLNSNIISVGASGAIFGLFGALLYFGNNYRGYVGAMVKSQILPIVIYNLVIGFFLPEIDMWGHVGGLIGGFLMANMLGTIENKKYNFNNIFLFILYFGFLVYLGLFR